MLRAATFLVFLALISPASAQTDELEPITRPAPALKAHVSVKGEYVRISDLVENAGAVGHVAVFRAPDLGDTGIVPVSRVVAALRPHNIYALDTRGLSNISVTHISRNYTAKDLEVLVARAIADQSRGRDARNITVNFDRIPNTLAVQADRASEPRLAGVSYDARSGRFDVAFDLPNPAGGRRNVLRFTGLALETTEVAVATRALSRGEILRNADVALERRPKTEIGNDAVVDLRAAIGLAARSTLRANQTLRQSDLVKPELVQRNEMVLLHYTVPGVTLTLRGKALESGSEGDVVNVMNVQSKRTFQGTVTGPGQITVSAPMPRVEANLVSPVDSAGATAPRNQE